MTFVDMVLLEQFAFNVSTVDKRKDSVQEKKLI